MARIATSTYPEFHQEAIYNAQGLPTLTDETEESLIDPQGEREATVVTYTTA